MLSVRHRTAGLAELWEYDPGRRALDVVLRRGSHVSAFRLDVCALSVPRIGAYAVVRVAASTWRVLPRAFGARGDGAEPRDRPIQPWMTLGDHLLLTDAPAPIDQELEELSNA